MTTTDQYAAWRAEITHRRETRGYSAKQAAARAGISDQRWRNLERGYEVKAGTHLTANPSRLTVVKMAQALRWDVAEALAEAGFDPPRLTELDITGEHDSAREVVDDLWSEISKPDQEIIASMMARLANRELPVRLQFPDPSDQAERNRHDDEQG